MPANNNGNSGADANKSSTGRKSWLRLVPLVVVIVGLVAAWQIGLIDFLSFDAFHKYRTILQSWVNKQGILAVIIYAFLYALVVAFSMPAGAVLTVIAGFLFGPFVGAIAVAVGATVGATALFLIARTATGNILRKIALPFLDHVRAGFQANAISYLLVLRLIPAFPFWLVNIVPALIGVKLWTYIWTTLVGILPATFAFTLFGQGLDNVFKACDNLLIINTEHVCLLPPYGEIITLEIGFALSALAILAVMPAIYQRFKNARD